MKGPAVVRCPVVRIDRTQTNVNHRQSVAMITWQILFSSLGNLDVAPKKIMDVGFHMFFLINLVDLKGSWPQLFNFGSRRSGRLTGGIPKYQLGGNWDPDITRAVVLLSQDHFRSLEICDVTSTSAGPKPWGLEAARIKEMPCLSSFAHAETGFCSSLHVRL